MKEQTEKKPAPLKQYATWDGGDDEYYQHFDSIVDAVSSNDDDEVEVYEVTYKKIGTYKEKKNVVKVRRK